MSNSVIISNENYHKDKSIISSTSLKYMLISPKHYKYYIDQEKKEPTPAMLFGSQYHSYLESFVKSNSDNLFKKEWINIFELSDIPINPTTGRPFGNDTKKMQDYFSTKGIDFNKIINPESFEIIKQMKNALFSSLEVRRLIYGATAEESFFAEMNGLKCKYRTDVRKETKKETFIIDWKTISDIELIEKSIAERKYHVSAAFYSDLDFLIHNKSVNFVWIFQETKPPYDFDIVWASPEDLAVGTYEYEIAMAQIKWCNENNIWEGKEVFREIYENNYRVRKQSKLPAWYMNQLKNVTFYNKQIKN